MENNDSKSISSLLVNYKFILRSTGEEVEVIASNLVENGARNEADWVTYIDSAGNEHIKEALNIQLDFKPSGSIPDLFKSMLDTKFEPMKFPSTENSRIFEVTKMLVVEKDYSVSDAVELAKQVTQAVGNDAEKS